MKMAKKTLSVFLSLLMVFGTCSVCLSGLSMTASAASSYTAEQVGSLVSAASESAASTSSSNNAWSYSGDDGTVLAAAEAVYDYAVGAVRATGTTANYNSSDTLSGRMNDVLGYDSIPNNSRLVQNILYPSGTTVYGYANRQKDGGNYTNGYWSGYGDSFDSSRVTYNGAVPNSVTKTATVSIDLVSYLLTFASISDIPASFPTVVKYTFTHTNATSYSYERSGEGRRFRPYSYEWDSYKWNYISSATRAAVSTNTTAKATLQSYAEYFSTDRLKTQASELLTQTAAQLQALYNQASGQYNALVANFGANVVKHFFDTGAIAAYLATVQYAMNVVVAHESIALMQGYMSAGYSNTDINGMTTLYTNASAALDSFKDLDETIIDYVIKQYNDVNDDFTVAAASEFVAALYYDIELYNLRLIKAAIDADIAANEAKLVDPLNEDDITNIELAALNDKFNGYQNAWEQYSEAARSEVFSDGMGYITTFRTDVETKIDARNVQAAYEPMYEYFLPYIFANVATWSNEDIMNRYTVDSVKAEDLFSNYRNAQATIGEGLTMTVYTFQYEGESYLLTTAVEDYLARLKQNIIDRNTAALDLVKTYSSMSTEVNFSNFIGLKTAIGGVDTELYTFANSKSWLSDDYVTIYNSMEKLLDEYNAFLESGGLNKFEQNHYHDENGVYTTRYAGEQEVGGNTVGYANDLARDGAEDNYDVTEKRLSETITKIDTFITSKDFCALVGLHDQDGKTYESLPEYIDALLTENIFNDDMVNTLLSVLFPMLSSTLEKTIKDLISGLGKGSYGSTGSYEISQATNLLKGPVYLFVDTDKYGTTQYQDDFPTVFAKLGLNVYPSTLAASLAKHNAAKFGTDTAVYEALTDAGRNWYKFYNMEEKKILTDIEWGVTDYDSFLVAVGAIFNAIEPVLQTLLCGQSFSVKVANAAYAYAPDIDGVPFYLAWVRDQTLAAYADITLTLTPLTLYKDVWIPVMEALGVTDGDYSFQSISASATAEQMAEALFEPIYELIGQLKTEPIQKVLEILPGLMYALSMDKLQDLIDGVTVKLNVVADANIDKTNSSWLVDVLGDAADSLLKGIVNQTVNLELSSLVNIQNMLGFEYTNINALIAYLFETLGLDLSLPLINAGEVILCSSYSYVPSPRTSGTRLKFTSDTTDVFYFLLNYIVNAVGNRSFVENIVKFIQNMNAAEGEEAEAVELPEIVYNLIGNVNSNPNAALAALVELFRPVEYDKEDYDWYESEYAYGDISGVTDASIIYLNYGNNWTKEKSQHVVDNVDELLEDILAMTGSQQTSVNAMLQETIAELFNNKNITSLIKGLVTLGVTINNDFLYELIGRETGVEIRTWYNAFGYLFPEVAAEHEVTPLSPTDAGYVGIPGVTATVSDVVNEETGEARQVITWSINGKEFTDGDRVTFVDLFCALCDEFAPIISLIFKGEDLSLFNEAITFLGYESYADSVGILFEVLGMTNVMTQAEYNAYCEANGDAAAFNYLTQQLFDWIDYMLEGNTIKKAIELLPSLAYFIQSNGIATMLHNCLMPVLVLLDDVRPIFDIDVNAILSLIISDLVSYGTVDFSKVLALLTGEYEGETDPNYTFCPVDVNKLTLNEIVKIVDAYFGTDFYSSQLMQNGISGLCAGRTAYNSVIGEAYTVSVDSADTLTILISSVLEALVFQIDDEGTTNGDILFSFIDEQTGSDTGSKIYNTMLNLFDDVVTDLEDIKWAYMYPDYNYENLKSLTLPQHSIVYLEYTNNWNMASADYVDSILSQLIDEILVATGNSDLSTLLTAAINKDVYSDKIFNMLIEAVVGLLVNLDDTILSLVDCVIDTNIKQWFDYCEFTENEDGSITVTCNMEWDVTDRKSFTAAFSEALSPAYSLISWLFFGTDYAFFTGTEQNEDGSYSYDSIITIPGGEGYAYGLVPILEALGCTMGYNNDSGINPASVYELGDGTFDVYAAINDVVVSLFAVLDDIGDAPIDTILSLLPNVVYFINAEGVKVSVNNLLAPIYSLINKLSPVVGEVNIDEAIGFPLSDLTWPTVFTILEEKLNLFIPEKCQELIITFFLGDVNYFTSANGRGSFYMSYNDLEKRRDMLTIVLSLFVDVMGYEKNAEQFTTWFGADAYSTIKNILDMADAKAMQDFSWYYTEYANTDTTFSAVDTSGRYVNTYNEYWTKDRAQYVADNLEAFVDNMLCLLGLEIEGVNLDSINEIVADLIDTNLYTQSNADAILGALKSLVSTISDLEPYGEYIIEVLKTSAGLDLTVWNDMTVTVIDGDRQSFTDALCQILVPALPLFNLLLNGEDVSFLINIDGEDMITIPGSEGYAYGIIPLLEALGCSGVLTPEEYKAAIAADPNALVTSIVDPVFNKLEDIKADPMNEIVAILPAVIYFINSNGLDTSIKNILNTVDTVLIALEPALGEQNCMSLFGLDQISTYDFEYIFNYALEAIYEATGYDLTPFAADAIAELTVGKVVTYDSKNGETYYTMKYASEMDKADMITIILRILIDFATTDENIGKIESILTDYITNEDTYGYVCSLLESLAAYAKQDPGMGQSMYVLFYIFYGMNNASEAVDDWYHDTNNSWKFILNLLDSSDEAMLNKFSSDLKDVLNKYFDGIFDEDGVASDGFVTFFQRIMDFFRKIAEFFQNLFS